MEQKQKLEKIQLLMEMVESMEESIENVKTVIKQQTELKDLIKKNDKKNYFDNFVKGLEKSTDDMNKQVETMIHRKELLESVCNRCKDMIISELVSDILEGLGTF